MRKLLTAAYIWFIFSLIVSWVIGSDSYNKFFYNFIAVCFVLNIPTIIGYGIYLINKKYPKTAVEKKNKNLISYRSNLQNMPRNFKDKIMGFFIKVCYRLRVAFKGEEKLWIIYWCYGVTINILAKTSNAYLDKYPQNINIQFTTIIVGIIAFVFYYLLLINILNVKDRVWSYIVLAITLLYLSKETPANLSNISIFALLFCVSMIIGNFFYYLKINKTGKLNALKIKLTRRIYAFSIFLWILVIIFSSIHKL